MAERITKERLKEIVGAGKLWCGDPETQGMARQLLAYGESGALEALRDAKEFIENQQLPCEEWARILDITVAAIARLEAIGE